MFLCMWIKHIQNGNKKQKYFASFPLFTLKMERNPVQSLMLLYKLKKQKTKRSFFFLNPLYHKSFKEFKAYKRCHRRIKGNKLHKKPIQIFTPVPSLYLPYLVCPIQKKTGVYRSILIFTDTFFFLTNSHRRIIHVSRENCRKNKYLRNVCKSRTLYGWIAGRDPVLPLNGCSHTQYIIISNITS